MSLASKLLSASGGVDKIFSEDVFSAYTYVGNGTTQTINNGIDLAGKGGMVWTKNRASSGYDHVLCDTVRGPTKGLFSSTTNSESTTAFLSSFGATGYVAGTHPLTNGDIANYVSWTFRKAPRFFDVVTYTGDNVSIGSVKAHTLTVSPGMVIIKATSTTSDWYVWHRGLTAGNFIKLNTIGAQSSLLANTYFGNGTTTVDPTASGFTVGLGLNMTGTTYVAYLFAHDTSADGIVQCGSFTIAAGARTTVNLGWEPQFLLMKSVTNAETWEVLDASRALTTDSTAAMLQPNSSAAESPAGTSMGARITATGFTSQNSNATYVYLAIRRPNKPPTLGTQVYNAIARTGTSAAATVTGVGFAPDLVTVSARSGVATGSRWADRLRGKQVDINSTSTNAEISAASALLSYGMDGVDIGGDGGWNHSAGTYINHFFKRAPVVFDSSCDTGTGSSKSESHNLKAVPELIIRKGRSGATQWEVYFAALGNTQKLVLNSTAAAVTDTTAWNSTTPTTSNFTVGTGANVNTNAATYVTYLASSLAGVSKVGTYVGNGTSLTINMGFTTGCRYFLVKASSTTGSWWVYDSVRGIVASADFALQLNSTAAEITSADCVDPASSGIVVNQEATCSINANGVTYQYWAFA